MPRKKRMLCCCRRWPPPPPCRRRRERSRSAPGCLPACLCERMFKRQRRHINTHVYVHPPTKDVRKACASHHVVFYWTLSLLRTILSCSLSLVRRRFGLRKKMRHLSSASASSIVANVTFVALANPRVPLGQTLHFHFLGAHAEKKKNAHIVTQKFSFEFYSPLVVELQCLV